MLKRIYLTLLRIQADLIRLSREQTGAVGMGLGILTAVIGIAITLIVLARAVPALWPLVVTTSGNITAMTGTDAGTTTIKAFWPIILLVVGLGIAVGLIVYALKRFNLLGGN